MAPKWDGADRTSCHAGLQATQDYKGDEGARDCNTCSREERSGPSFSRGRGMASWWWTGKKKILFFFLEVFKGFVEDEDGDDETININR